MTVPTPPSREQEILKNGYAPFFETQTVFLTGSTGSLGGCLLYKLALQLPTRKIFVLIRKSSEAAIEKWKNSMPQQTQAILHTRKVHFLVGDMTKSDFGIEEPLLEQLRNEVTLVIHAAANITFAADIKEAIERNCLPPLELGHIASRFRRLKLFIQISTAYGNSFLPDGYVGERRYNISDEDPEDELANIMSSGSSPLASRFSSSYAQAKHLMEELFLKRYPLLPLLLARPTIFGAAMRHPYPLYGLPGSTPMRKFAEFQLRTPGETQIWHAAEGYKTGANVLDEIPVDFVANACLLHAAANTQGIVHIGSQLYVPMTFDDFMDLTRDNAPPEFRKDLPAIVFTEDRSVQQHFVADLVKVATRNWIFECGRSYWLKQMAGPLSLAACQHEADELNAARMKEIYAKDLKRKRAML